MRSELDLPEGDEEFEDYADRIRRKRFIDQQAQYGAQLTALPWFVQVIMALIVIAAIAIVVVGYMNFSQAQSGADDEFCRAAAEQGIEHPAC